ncbi:MULTISPECIES: DddA-like double-stranded DNA deaminase toxin [Actinosynnema]|uniref:DddA-like double-stranded DNA deaminase toxin n=1 Tax=Actinosynnema TaxID=40566 RepID=UPI0020A52D32|nr:DddA-like double-stranded DNA deaminase toxin [Actinosynnema pretiosum]MCP2095582.1 SCP1.201-like deaminase [Actinosynnema pretiosum]
MSLGEVLDAVEQACDLLDRARELLTTGGSLGTEAFTELIDALAGSSVESDAMALHEVLARIEKSVPDLEQAVEQARDGLLRWSTSARVGNSPQVAPPEGSASGWASPAGDHYPARAEWARALVTLPHSPTGSGIQVEAYVRAVVPPSEATLPWSPADGLWAQAARDHLAALRAPPWAIRRATHIEPQIAQWQRESGIRHVSVVLNRAPCGMQEGLGCHQLVPLLLPPGYRMEMSGTHGGRSFYEHDYQGREA